MTSSEIPEIHMSEATPHTSSNELTDLPSASQQQSPTKPPFWTTQKGKMALIIGAIVLIVGGFGFGLWESFGNHTAPASTEQSPQPSPTTSATPDTEVTPTTSAEACSGDPIITSFVAVPASIQTGASSTLSWDTVNNTDLVSIDNAIGTVSNAAGNKVVKPTKTTTYIMTASCGTKKVTKQVIVTVVSPFAVSSVTASADPSTFSGTCPKTFNFTGNITTTAAGTVKYKWERSDGSSTAETSLTFSSASSQDVTDSWSRNSTENGWERVKITSPNSLTSSQANYTLTCDGANFGGSWYHNFGTANVTQNGNTVTGTYVNGYTGASGSLAGTVTGNTLNGTWSISGNSGAFVWNAPNLSANTFTGNWGGTNNWCGAKSGQQFPDNCGFQGSWTQHPGASPQNSMTMTQNGTAVTGSYQNSGSTGTINGTVSYTGGEAKLTGTWNINGGSGAFTYYLQSYAGLQFKGNYDTVNQWCGWRSSSSEPSPCLK